MRVESEEQHAVSMTDLASVRLVHGPVMNRMTKQEVIPRVEFISFCPHSSTLFCVTGAAIFKIFQIDQQSLHQQIVHFRAEFYAFTCHCWLDANSIVVGVRVLLSTDQLYIVLLLRDSHRPWAPVLDSRWFHPF